MSAIHFKVITTAKDVTSHRVKRKFEGRVLIVVLVTVLTFAAMPRTSFAGNSWVEMTKTVTYSFNTNNLNNVVGEYYLCCRAEAKCGHNSDSNYPPIARNVWLAKDGLPEVSLSAATNQNKVPNAYAEGKIFLSAGIPQVTGTNQYKVDLVEKGKSLSWTSDCDVNSKQSIAKPAYCDPRGWIRGARLSGWELESKVNSVEQERQSSKNKAKGEVKGGDGGEIFYKEPISVTLTELDTGIESTEELFSVELYGATGLSEISFDYDLETGLSLRALKNNEGVVDGSIGISGAATSDWLVDPFGEFGAFLDGGAFAATGVWAGLPWVLTYDGPEVTEVFLAAEYLPANFDYVVPDSLINDSYEYEQSLLVDAILDSSHYRSIPEPMTLLLLGFGSLVLLRRKA